MSAREPTDPTQLIARVRKLLALANSPNVHEAAAAAAAAQALIERHRLGRLLEAEADDPITGGRDTPLDVAKRPRRWKQVLASSLASANGCVAYSAEVGRETHLLLAGRASDRTAVAALWEWLVSRIEWLSATHGAGRNRAWHEAFRIGAAEVIVARLHESRAVEQAALGEAALVRVLPALAARAAAVSEFVDAHLRLAAGRVLQVDARGLASGRAAGVGVALP